MREKRTTSLTNAEMKIHFVAPRYHTNLLCWTSLLNEMGHDVSMTVFDISKIESHMFVAPHKVKKSLASVLLKWFLKDKYKTNWDSLSVATLFEIAYKIRPEYIVVRGLNRISTFQLIFLSIFVRSRIVVYSQTDYYRRYSKSKKVLLDFFLSVFNLIWVTPVKRRLSMLNNPKRSSHIKRMEFVPFCSICDASILNNVDATGEQVRILCISKYQKRKNIDCLVQALKFLPKTTRLTIIGELTTNEHHKIYSRLRELVNELSLNSRVDFYTNIPPQKMRKFYLSSDLFVLPSHSEPAAVSIIEALSCGLPVICSDDCGTDGYIEEEFGEVFKSNDFDDFLSVLNRVITPSNLVELKANIENARPREYYLNKAKEEFIRIFEL